jgi:hypothetical protein
LDDKIAWYENDGSGTFTPQQIITTAAAGAESVFAADLNGDGDNDVLSASSLDDKIAWYENEGSGTFGIQQVIPGSFANPRTVVTGDLDGDGDNDVVSASDYTGGRIVWFDNVDGAGSFGLEQVVAHERPSCVFLADLDGDGDSDVMSESYGGGAWYENRPGLSSIGVQRVIAMTGGIDGAAGAFAADLDGDGDNDVLSASSGDDKIAWHENISGSFGSIHIITTSANGAQSVFAADLDGDGDSDTLSASSGDDKIAWYENVDGAGAFGPQQMISDSADGAQTVFAADLDGDGDNDVLSASYDDDKIAWYENVDGAGAFGSQQIITDAADGAQSVFAADVDGDGDNDVLSASSEDDKIAWHENMDGAGAFGPQQIISQSANFAMSVFAADLDGDGDTDVLSASQDDKIAWYENVDGAGAFGPQQIISTLANGAQSVFAADLDGDGDDDVLSASGQDDKIAWYENVDGAGAFGPQQIISTLADNAQSVFAVDLDGDGDTDVLSASYYDDKIASYENVDGNGSFGPQTAIVPVMGAPSFLLAADLDGDEDRDVVAGSINKLVWYENVDDGGGFSVALAMVADVASAFAVDVDGDSDIDLLAAFYNDDTIAWYENVDGLGTFAPLQVISTAVDGARSVFAADLDGDGDHDVLSASYLGATIAWHENVDGSGGFGPPQTISASVNGVKSVLAADLDGDGDEDVLCGASLHDTVSWYENLDGAGTFGSVQFIALPANGAAAVAAADLDRDGDNDVLSAGYDAIAWYENMNGAGAFGPRQLVTADSPYPQTATDSFFPVDMDGDGDLDILYTEPSGYLYGWVVWQKNVDGAGTFAPFQVVLTSSPDSRLVLAADLDSDGIDDILAASTEMITWHPTCYRDCDANGTPDENDLADCDPEADPACGDCNLNSIPDSCDIASQPSEDNNGNGIPDECDAQCLADCADVDADGIRDEACAWHDCVSASCVTTAKTTPADVGDLSGACPPDGACDAGDRFHALNCFADQNTLGAPPYGCEYDPPVAFNVDAGGPGACALDGVCDGSDAFHALNCFSNVNFQGQPGYPCTCAGPAPDAGGTAVARREKAGLLLRGLADARPGELIDVDVFLANEVEALRGYQLHLGTSGGKSGRLELVDIAIREPSAFSTPNARAGLKPMRAGLKPAPTSLAGAWSAFNTSTQQMLAGLDNPEGVPAAAGAYLATFTYRVPENAAGTFTIEVLYSDGAGGPTAQVATRAVPQERTFLFGRYGGLIDLTEAAPVSVKVTPASRSRTARAARP